MSDAKTLYEIDFFAWTQQQGKSLRAAAGTRTNQPIDWENVAEEIESLGRSDKRELHSQIRRVIEHLLKLENSCATEPRAGWIGSIVDARNHIEVVLEDSPSLRNEVGPAIGAELTRAARKAISELENYGETDPAFLTRIRGASYTTEQVVGEWLPPEPPGEEKA